MVTEHWEKLPYNLKSRYASKRAAILRRKPSFSEGVLMQKLTDAGFLHYRFQQIFYDNEILGFADFFLRKPLKLVIEVDGPYHFTKTQQKRDRQKDWFYTNNRHIHSVLRMTDEQAINISVEELKKLINGLNKGGITILYEITL